MVSTLRRVPFGRTQKEPKGPSPIVRPSLRSGSLAPVLLRGPAATGHPWPIAALPASMPVDPLHRTSSRPPGRAGRSKNTAPRGGRPAGLFGSRVLRNLCSRCRGTKAAIGDEVVAKTRQGVVSDTPGSQGFSHSFCQLLRNGCDLMDVPGIHAGRPTPQNFLSASREGRQIKSTAADICTLWEPGLPAMQTPRSICMTDVLPSRASPLPQKSGVVSNFCFCFCFCCCHSLVLTVRMPLTAGRNQYFS